jgi:hypothetical protein
MQDWVTQVTIGFFMGTFIYLCLCFSLPGFDERDRELLTVRDVELEPEHVIHRVAEHTARDDAGNLKYCG